MLPVPSVNDMDSGVSSGYSGVSGDYSVPTGISSSRRSSICSVGCESLLMDSRIEAKPYFRQISFDDAWEKPVTQNCTKSVADEVSFIGDSLSPINAPTKYTKRRNAMVGFKSLKDTKIRLKLIPGRRKSVSTRSKAI